MLGSVKKKSFSLIHLKINTFNRKSNNERNKNGLRKSCYFIVSTKNQ